MVANTNVKAKITLRGGQMRAYQVAQKHNCHLKPSWRTRCRHTTEVRVDTTQHQCTGNLTHRFTALDKVIRPY